MTCWSCSAAGQPRSTPIGWPTPWPRTSSGPEPPDTAKPELEDLLGGHLRRQCGRQAFRFGARIVHGLEHLSRDVTIPGRGRRARSAESGRSLMLLGWRERTRIIWNVVCRCVVGVVTSALAGRWL